jgi:hypothetical protein
LFEKRQLVRDEPSLDMFAIHDVIDVNHLTGYCLARRGYSKSL